MFKTLREILQAGHYVLPNSMVAMLEAREKERDEAERERVLAVVCDNLSYLVVKDMNQIRVIDFIRSKLYPHPEPEKLPAGWYWGKEKNNKEWEGCYQFYTDFKPEPGMEYRRWDDPPPEVTGKTDLTTDRLRDPDSWGKV